MRRFLERPGIGHVVALVVAWVILITGLHVAINHRPALAPGAEARTLQVGGLPVT
jgi:hypothetical protein